jgi:hypothetical protein
MIAAQVAKISHDRDLRTGEVTVRLGFELPTGDIVYADAPPGVLEKLERYNFAPPESVPEAPPQVSVPQTQEDTPEGYEPAGEVEEYGSGAEEGYDSEDTVEWTKLPETLLAEHVKKAMLSLQLGGQGLPPTLQLGQVIQIRDSILDEYTPDDWERLGFVAEQPTNIQKPGSIQWAEGGTQQPRSVPQRRVNRVDEKGNPIVRGNPTDVDPGEIAMADDDDTDQF